METQIIAADKLNWPILQQVDSKTFETECEIEYNMFSFGCLTYNYFTIPKGFKTDLASIPRPFRNFINSWGGHTAAAVLHDYLYAIVFPRKIADEMFIVLCKAYGVSRIKRAAMWYALRAFGWIAWNRHKNSGNFIEI